MPAPGRVLALGSAGFALALVVLTALGLHGFSLPAWREVIDGSKTEEVLLGRVRAVRSDDWAVALPLALSQRAQTPPFPVSNPLAGFGKGLDGRVGSPVPMRSWLTVFRPQTWGYFLGDDAGLAWHWWSRALGLVWAFWLAFTVVGRGRPLPALAAAVALAFQPFFQFWSYVSEPIATSAALGFVAAAGIALAGSTAAIALHGALLAWAAGCFALSWLYPPFQIPLAWLLAALAAAWAWRERERIARAGRWPLRAGVAAAALALAGVLVAVWAAECREPLGLLAGTAYPGHRRIAGGDVSVPALLNAFETAFLRRDGYAPLGNVCDAASFQFLSPAILAFVALEALLRRRRPDPIVTAVGIYTIVLSLHALVGLPAFLGSVTLLDRVPGGRSVVGIGVASLVMTVAFVLGRRREDEGESRGLALVVAAAWAAAVLASGWRLVSFMPALARWTPFAGALGGFVAAFLVLTRHRAGLPLLAAAAIASTAWFNPLVRGGAEYLRENELSRRILALDREEGGKSVWVVYNDRWLSNLFRAIGVHAVGGVHYYPQRELWSRLDPAGASEAAWNRYAHVVFAPGTSLDDARISAPFFDTVLVSLSPESQQFRRIGVSHVLVVGEQAKRFDRSPVLSPAGRVGNKHLYRVSRRPRSEEEATEGGAAP